MRVALTAWEDKISPVFDCAQTLLIADIHKKNIISRNYIFFNPEKTSRLEEALNKLNLNVLICGAISEIPANIIKASGITLIAFIGGNVEHVLEAYANGLQIVPGFLMPGCGPGCGPERGPKRGQAQGQARERRSGIAKHLKEVSTMPKVDKTGPKGKCDGTGRSRGGCNPRKSGRGERQGAEESMGKRQKDRQHPGTGN